MSSLATEELELLQQIDAERNYADSPENGFEFGDEIPDGEGFEDFVSHTDETIATEGAAAEGEPQHLIDDIATHSHLPRATVDAAFLHQGVNDRLAPLKQGIRNLTTQARHDVSAIAAQADGYVGRKMADGTLLEQEPKTEKEQTFEQFAQERSTLLGNMFEKITSRAALSAALDFVPVVGGIKMVAEGIGGTTLGDRKLNGKERVIHAAIGAASVFLDLTLVGVGEAEGLKLVGRSAGALEKMGARLAATGNKKMAMIVGETLEFVLKHPHLVRLAEELAQRKLKKEVKKGIKTVREYPRRALHKQGLGEETPEEADLANHDSPTS